MDGRPDAPVLIRVLGPLDIVAGERRRTLGSPRQRQLLAQLVVHAGHVVAIDALVDGLWGDAPPRTAAHTVQGLVSRLRSAVGPRAIVARPPGYVLVLDEVDLDREHFESGVARARALVGAGDTEQAVRAFDAALGWWRGRAYEEVADCPFARGDATRLEEVRAAVIEDRADALLASGPASELVGDLQEAARDEPYRERRQGQLMVALARAGRPIEAMRSYEEFRRRLADEVGVIPSRSLQALNDDILRQAPGTEWRSPSPGSPAPPAPAPTRLPRPVTSLVGRADEIAALVGTLQTPGLVTICGPGGVGKTRLAVEVSRALESVGRSGDGVWWCDLSAVSPEHERGGDEVDHAVAAVLGVSSAPDPSVRDRILGFLAARDLTLVIDNCEHVIGPVAALAAGILQRAPTVGVLATSREPLAIDGEHVVDLGPLDDHDSRRLFAERGAAVRGGFRVDPDNAEAVAEICRRLDGVPLAIELVAGRLQSLGVSDLARLLDDRFRVLVTDRRDVPDRHRSLRAVIAGSYEALSPRERAAYGLLSVFPAGFGLDAAEAVCAEGPSADTDVLEVLSRLVARSLLVAEPDPHGAVRYRLLESIRSDAHERLVERGPDAIDVAHRRHADHFASLIADAASAITGPDETRWVTCLAEEIPNLRTAVHWAASRADLDLATSLFAPLPSWTWCGSSRTAEIARWAELVVHLRGIEDHPAYPAVCEWGCRGSLVEPVRAKEWSARVTAPDFSPTPCTMGFLALVTMAEDAIGAHALLLRAADLARARDDRFTEAALRTFIANSQLSYSSPSRDAGEQPRLSMEAATASGSPTAIAWALLYAAMAAPSAGRDRDATLDELQAAVARCAFPDTNLQHGADYARGFLQLVDGDRAGLAPLRDEIRDRTATWDRAHLTVHLLRLAQVLVHLDVRLDRVAELIAGVRAHRLIFTPKAEEITEVLRDRLGDGPFQEAVARGACLSLERLAERALATIDELLTADR